MLQQYQLTLTPNTYTKNLPKQMPWKQPPILMQWIYYILKTVIVQHNHTHNSTSTNAPNSNSALSMLKSSKNYTHWNLYISLKTKKMMVKWDYTWHVDYKQNTIKADSPMNHTSRHLIAHSMLLIKIHNTISQMSVIIKIK